MTRTELPETIETPRLTLRGWQFDDVNAAHSCARDEAWAQYLRMPPLPNQRRDAVEFIARQTLLDRIRRPSWAIVLDREVVGGINLRLDFPNRLGELGYSIARRAWNKRYVTEAARAVIDLAFSAHEDLNRIRAFADVGKLASQRVMEKVGMTTEGVLRQNRVKRGAPLDEAWFGILRREWSLGTSR
jgi:[ribosomal protein S5]-alanine N-acetyltransferase